MSQSRIGPLLLAIVVSASMLRCSEPEIQRADVERIVGTLAADDMQGRQTFTPGIDKAAAFLQSEFEKIGLEQLPEVSGYSQAFNVYSLTPADVTVQLNGKRMDRSNVFVSSAQAELMLSVADVKVVAVGENGDLRQAFGAARNADGSTLLLVHPKHEDLFARYQQFLSGPNRVVELGVGPNVVGILTSEGSAKSLDVKANYMVETQDLANVLGMISGKRPNEFVLFSAHYDHIGIRTTAEGDSIANGANDDASGVAAVVELARYFKAKGEPERSLLFVAFTAEEMGGYGSRYFSQQLDPDQIVAMFNIEMIGKPAVSGPNTAWITGFERSDFGEILQRAVEGTDYEFYADPYPDQNLFYRSDNATLARLGVPAHSISTTPIDVDTDYHQVSDELETLDLDHLTNTIKAIAAGAATIVSGKETPTRVDPEQMR
jgi:hypothetical protein